MPVQILDQITTAELVEWFRYDPETGKFFWLKDKARRKAGDEAGKRSTHAVQLKLHQKVMMAHRAAWFFVYGVFPDRYIDHIDGDGHNNKIENLRLATNRQNGKNRKLSKNNKVGFKGVWVRKKDGKFCAHITSDCVKMFLGSFDTAEMAHEAYCAAALKFHGEFARLV